LAIGAGTEIDSCRISPGPSAQEKFARSGATAKMQAKTFGERNFMAQD